LYLGQRKAGHRCADIIAIDKMNDKWRGMHCIFVELVIGGTTRGIERHPTYAIIIWKSIQIVWEVENSGVGLKSPRTNSSL
jgi:hypothetical protein